MAEELRNRAEIGAVEDQRDAHLEAARVGLLDRALQLAAAPAARSSARPGVYSVLAIRTSLAGSPSASAPDGGSATPSTREQHEEERQAAHSAQGTTRGSVASRLALPMSEQLDLTGTGLEGVSLGRTEIALVDGQNGRLIYRGHDAERLAEERRFEEVAYLLWHGDLPDAAELAELHGARDRRAWSCPPAVHETMRALLPGRALDGRAAKRPERLGDAAQARGGRRCGRRDLGARRGARRWWRTSRGSAPGRRSSSARPELTLVENFMLKMSGELPDPPKARALDAYFTLAAEHGMNASTFTARVIVSTLSDLGSGLVGAVGALKGRLHGGAPSHVSHMIDEIGTAENAEPWLREKLDAGERLMGFGHRVYRTYDPRARALGKVAETLAGSGRAARRSHGTSRRRRCACCTSTSRTGRCTRTSSTTRPRCSATSTSRPTCTRRRSLRRARRAGRRTCSSSSRTTG